MMQHQEIQRRQSQERQSRTLERKPAPAPVIQKQEVSSSSSQRQEMQQRHESQTVQRQERSVSRKESQQQQKKESKTEKKIQKKQSKQEQDVVNIPVKNYRSRSISRREPSPPVDYPAADYSDDTDETDVRIADYENNDKKHRRKSVQSFSKKTSVTRNYPGCVLM